MRAAAVADLFTEGNNTKTTEMFNLRCLITCLLVFITKAQSVNVSGRDGEAFLEKILRYYGQNKSISTENLEDLLLIISDRNSHLITEGNPLADQEVSKNFYIYYYLLLLVY